MFWLFCFVACFCHVFEICLVVLRSRTTVGAVMARTAWEKKKSCRSSAPNVSGKVECGESFRATVCRASSPIVGGYSAGLRERARSAQQQEGRPGCIEEEEEELEGRQSITKEEEQHKRRLSNVSLTQNRLKDL